MFLHKNSFYIVFYIYFLLTFSGQCKVSPKQITCTFGVWRSGASRFFGSRLKTRCSHFPDGCALREAAHEPTSRSLGVEEVEPCRWGPVPRSLGVDRTISEGEAGHDGNRPRKNALAQCYCNLVLQRSKRTRPWQSLHCRETSAMWNHSTPWPITYCWLWRDN